MIRFENMLEMDTHAVPIGPDLEMATVGAADYPERRGVPQTPEDLLAHDGLYFAIGNAKHPAPWIVENEGGSCAVTPRRPMVVKNIDPLVDYAVAGVGLAYVYAATAQSMIDAGKLVRVLDRSTP